MSGAGWRRSSSLVHTRTPRSCDGQWPPPAGPHRPQRETALHGGTVGHGATLLEGEHKSHWKSSPFTGQLLPHIAKQSVDINYTIINTIALVFAVCSCPIQFIVVCVMLFLTALREQFSDGVAYLRLLGYVPVVLCLLSPSPQLWEEGKPTSHDIIAPNESWRKLTLYFPLLPGTLRHPATLHDLGTSPSYSAH